MAQDSSDPVIECLPQMDAKPACMKSACRNLAAPNVSNAVAWYRDRLGFGMNRETADYAIIYRDTIELHPWKCDDRRIAENTSAHTRVHNIDELQPSLSGASTDGGRISEIETRDWGMRAFYVWDPAGNLLRFGQRDIAATGKLS